MPNPLTAALQHILKQNPWAQAKLSPFAGKIFTLRLPPLAMQFAIQPDGNVNKAEADAATAATLEISPAALVRYLSSTPRDSSLLTLSGDADLGIALREVFTQMNWEAEEDLSHILGDVLAHRVAGAARGFAHWGKRSAEQLAEACAEYLSEDRPVLVKGVDLSRMRTELDALQIALSQLEQRIAHLHRS